MAFVAVASVALAAVSVTPTVATVSTIATLLLLDVAVDIIVKVRVVLTASGSPCHTFSG